MESKQQGYGELVGAAAAGNRDESLAATHGQLCFKFTTRTGDANKQNVRATSTLVLAPHTYTPSKASSSAAALGVVMEASSRSSALEAEAVLEVLQAPDQLTPNKPLPQPALASMDAALVAMYGAAVAAKAGSWATMAVKCRMKMPLNRCCVRRWVTGWGGGGAGITITVTTRSKQGHSDHGGGHAACVLRGCSVRASTGTNACTENAACLCRRRVPTHADTWGHCGHSGLLVPPPPSPIPQPYLIKVALAVVARLREDALGREVRHHALHHALSHLQDAGVVDCDGQGS